MSTDDGAVRITLRDVYETAQRVENSVGLLVLGFDQLKTLTGDHETRLRQVETEGRTAAALVAGAETDAKTTADHEVRIRAVERRVWSIPSFAVLIGAAALVVSILGMMRNSPTTVHSAPAPITSEAPHPVAVRSVSGSKPVPVRAPATSVSSPQTGSQSTPKPVSPAPAPTSPVTAPRAPVVTRPNLPVSISKASPVATLVQALESVARPPLSLTH